MKLQQIRNPSEKLTPFIYKILDDGKGNWLAIVPSEIKTHYVQEVDETFRFNTTEDVLETLMVETENEPTICNRLADLFDTMIIRKEQLT